jgi:hypothetical protein
VGCQFEMGTLIGITRRNSAKNKIIRFYYCVFHYDRILKTERYVSVQVVLLLTLTVPYQGFDLEVVLKYGNGDISRSSLVFRCSKDDESERRTTTSINPRHKTYGALIPIKITLSKSVRQVSMKGDYIVTSSSLRSETAS